MRTRTIIVGLWGLGALLLALAAEDAPSSAAPPCCRGGECTCAKARSRDDFVALERFLVMSDEQLDRIQQAIAKVRAMGTEERAALHARMHEFRQLPAAEQEQVRAGAGWADDLDRRDWPEMMRSLPEAERAAIHAELRTLAPAERAARKHALLEVWRRHEPRP